MTKKHTGAVMLGSIKSPKKANSSRINGLKGGYWKQERNRLKPIFGLNKQYETHGDNSLNRA